MGKGRKQEMVLERLEWVRGEEGKGNNYEEG